MSEYMMTRERRAVNDRLCLGGESRKDADVASQSSGALKNSAKLINVDRLPQKTNPWQECAKHRVQESQGRTKEINYRKVDQVPASSQSPD
jgi:hypothetical protein